MLQDIGETLKRIPRNLRLYPDNQNLHSSVKIIFENIFEFSTKAKHVFRMGRSKTNGRKSMNIVVSLTASLKLLWKPFEVQFGEIRDNIAKSVTDIETEAELAEKELVHDNRTKDDNRWSKAEASQQLLSEFIDHQSWSKVVEWLSPANVTTNHKAATNLRHRDTGTWFLESESFQNWLDEDNSFLWLHASPGAGKTILASSIINYLQENVQSKSTGLAYFYCDYADTQKQEPSKVLGTILASLARQSKGVFEAIQKFFLQQYKDTASFTAGFDELRTNFCSFITGHFQSVIIVVDALDESSPANWNSHGNDARWDCLARALQDISQQCGVVKILVTSRNELSISRIFETLPRTSIEESDVTSDISDYITAELSAKISQRKLKLRNPKLESKIRDQLVQRSKGMFQWARCQIEALCRFRNDKAIEAALDNLPKTLHDTYSRILQRVENDHPEDIDVVRNMLKWLVRSVRAMTLDELAEAMAVDPEDDATSMDLSAVDTDPEDILNVLGSLVTVSASGIVSLAHYSVKEFLISDDMMKQKPRFWVGHHEVEAQLARVCLTFLCYDDFMDTKMPVVQELEERLAEYKLYRYATEAWALHANRSEKQGCQPEEIVDLTMRLFRSTDDTHANFSSWVECYQYCNFNKQSRKRIADPIFVAAYFGLTEATTALLHETPVDQKQLGDCLVVAAANGHASVVEAFLNYSVTNVERSVEWEDVSDDSEQVTTDTEGETELGDEAGDESHQLEDLQSVLPKALYAAAAKGHAEVVSLLLSNGAEIDARGGRDGTALQAAALEGRADVVQILLQNGASHREACKRYGTPLSAAAEKAHHHTCDILLKHGANPNGSGGWHSLPLVAAIVGKNMNIVRQIIEAGADLNRIVGGRHGGPLPAAASFGLDDLISELVSHGAKVNDDDDKASDALYAASLTGHKSTVKLLLELGADVNAKGGRHRNALGVASAEGNVEVVQMLLDAGADVDYFDEHWGNALQAAAQGGHAAVVTVLAECGMDPNATASGRGTALMGAAANGHDDVIKTLFSLGVPSGDTWEMTSALIAASSGGKKGYTSTVQLLVDRGANVNRLSRPSQTAGYCRPLQAAAFKGHVEIVKLLLALGADANGADEGWYGTALVAAVNAKSYKPEIVTILLDAGANVNEVSPLSSNFHGTPLIFAVREDHTDCTNILLDKGADVNSVGVLFPSPLMMAVGEDNEPMVELLLKHGAEVNLVAEPANLRNEISEGLSDGTITVLQTAAWNGHENMVRKFVGLGARLSENSDEAAFTSALQAAAYCDHVEVVRVLIELGSDVNERGGYFGSALQAAAHRGSLDSARILLEAGAVANEIDIGHFHSALLAACMEDYETTIDLVKLLVEHGADVRQKQKGPYPYALHAVTKLLSDSQETLMSFLIEAGADVDAVGGLYGTALQSAAVSGDQSAIQLLIDAGADVNVTGGFYHTPLQAAYRHGFYQSIWLLYNHGARNDLVGGSRAGSAIGQGLNGRSDDTEEVTGCCSTLVNQAYFRHNLDPNLEYGLYGNALQHAAMTRDVEDVATIINAGADINKIGGKMGTAITAAAFEDDMEPFNLLLDSDADINIGNYRYPNAAFGAIRGKCRDKLKLLIEKGIDVKTPSGHFGTTAQCAALTSDLSLLRMVLRAGAEINPPDCGLYGSPLQAAAWTGNEEMVRYLLHRNADVHAKHGRFGGVLNTAALECNADIVELMLKKGADVNERGRIYGTPLQAAVCEGDMNNVLVLLRYGADVNISRGRYGTALQAACAAGRYIIVKLLVERGADANMVGGRYRSPLSAAAIRGDEQTVRYLLDCAGATWSLVDRKKLGHVAAAVLDKADELLLRVQESLEINGKAQEEDTDQGAKVAPEPREIAQVEMKGTPKKSFLLRNVDSIPNAYDAYEPSQSRWGIVREMSFHSFAKRFAGIGAPNGSKETGSEAGVTNSSSRTPTLRHTDSNFSTGSGRSTPKSQNSFFQTKTACQLDSGGLPQKDWDGSVLDWVQVLD
jgi:ankyrin repeat protein